MTQTTKSLSVSYESTTTIVREIIESLSHGQQLVATTTEQPKGEVVVLRSRPNVKVPQAFSGLDGFVDELIAEDNSFAEKMSSARKTISEVIAPDTGTLKARRLLLGLSQGELAAILGTSQPHIARLEKNPSSMMFETAIKLSVALNINIADMAVIAGLSMSKQA